MSDAFPIQQFLIRRGMIPWLLNLATRALARCLNMPEPLVHTTGVFVFAHVQAVENSVGKTLCPSSPVASAPGLVPPTGALIHPPPPQPKENCHDPSIPVSAPRHPG